jgi:hypothetical protein
LTPLAADLSRLTTKTRVAVAGAGAADGVDGVQALDADPVTAALSV